MTLGQYVRDWRAAQRPRVSQEALAERMVATGLTTGATGGWVSYLEGDKLGTIGVDKLRALAAVLQVPETDLSVLMVAGLAGAPPADELSDLLQRARALGIDAGLLQALDDLADDVPAEKRRQLVDGVRREVIRRETQRQQQEDDPPVGAPAIQAAAHDGAGEAYRPDWAADGAGSPTARIDARTVGVHEGRVRYST
jgi:transcriptional regulator with XRE-family HTH domain